MQFLSEKRMNGCQIFGQFGFLKSESELNFGFPGIPTFGNICDVLLVWRKGNIRTVCLLQHCDRSKHGGAILFESLHATLPVLVG